MRTDDEQDPSRPQASKPSNVYSFDKVFSPSASQDTCFSGTTLPLVKKLLRGENGLIFAYGVSNSGKSYTISGGNGGGPEERGLLPRSMDVIFNSIGNLHSDLEVSPSDLLIAYRAEYDQLRCTGMADVELAGGESPFKHAFEQLRGSEGKISTTESESYLWTRARSS